MSYEIFMEEGGQEIVEAICALSDKQRKVLLNFIKYEEDIYMDDAGLYTLEDIEENDGDTENMGECVTYGDLKWLHCAITYVQEYK